MKYILFIGIDIVMYPFLLLLYVVTWFYQKIKFVPLFYIQNKGHSCTSEILSGRKKSNNG